MSLNIAIFASGNGSNAENICTYFRDSEQIQVKLLVCNKSKAEVLKKMETYAIETVVIENKALKQENFIAFLKEKKIDAIILAGYLALIPNSIILQFPNKIINLHPSLLPKYGGKGMYGDYVHEAVLEKKEWESGITIHLVNEEYDKGEILFQSSVLITDEETIHTLKSKIKTLEIQFYPQVIESYLIKE